MARNSQALGYFNLFSLAAMPNRYPARTPHREWEYDDFLFTTSFAPEKRRMLPFSAIHLGKYGVNWDSRVSGQYKKRERGDETLNGGRPMRDFPANRKGGVAAVLGYFPEGRWQGVTRGFSRVILVDEFRIHPTGGDPMVEADRKVLRRILEKQVSGRKGVEFFGRHTFANVSNIPDRSLSLLYLPGKASPEWLCSVLPHWLPKVREGGVFCGDAYGLPHWPDATYSLAMLLGPPDEMSGDGRWRKRYRARARPLPGEREGNPDENDGIIVLSGGIGSTESLLLSIHSVRKHWAGPVQVWHQGIEDESLRMVCTRLGIEFFPVCSKIRATDEFTSEACQGAGFRRTLILKPGHVLIGNPQFDRGSDREAGNGNVPLLVSRNGDLMTVRPAAFMTGAEFDRTKDETILLRRKGVRRIFLLFSPSPEVIRSLKPTQMRKYSPDPFLPSKSNTTKTAP